MSEQMSIKDIQEVVDRANKPVLDHLNKLECLFNEAVKDIGTIVTDHAVLRNDLNNHKEVQMQDLTEINKSLSLNWDKTRRMDSFMSKWIGGAVAVSSILSTTALILAILNGIK